MHRTLAAHDQFMGYNTPSVKQWSQFWDEGRHVKGHVLTVLTHMSVVVSNRVQPVGSQNLRTVQQPEATTEAS